MSTFVLIHGAWHGAWCWYKVVPLLRKKGHRVIAPDLPGHGIDRTPLAEVTLQRYADHVCGILDAAAEPVVLVGHSMGGFVITEAAEQRPHKVARLVYLAAALAGNGTAITEFTQKARAMNPQHDGIIVDEKRGCIRLEPDVIREKFYADCSDDDVTLSRMLLTPQPALAFQATQRSTTENWGRIPRNYIECQRDNALPLEMQRDSQRQLPCRRVISMDTSHSPFFSRPAELVEHLVAD